jgi:CO/xanthine dehydrogenase Mo-binding subunit
VLSRGTIHAAGPYFCPNVRIRSKAVATNAPPHGAFRGFGAPQSVFALELQMDKVAAAAGLTPEEFRRRNFISTGETNAVGQVLREPVDMPRLLDRAFELSDYHAKSGRFAHDNPAGSIRRGIGFACFMHGAGFTGSGEEHLASLVTVEAARDGHIRVLAASTEIGQGTNTVFAQIASDALGIDSDDIEIVQPDTSAVPNSGPTVASRTSMVVGKLVETAALGVRSTLISSGVLPDGYGSAAFRTAAAAYVASNGSLRSTAQYHPPGGLHWDDEKYQGDAYGAYAWAVYVAEVAVDLTTFETRVEDFVAVQEVGRVINPILAAGQIEGGVAQAIGWALYEDVVWREGRMINGQMTNYIMPSSVDLPDIRVDFVEFPYPHGPGGAKGIGELPMDGPAPAIFNAVRNATGLEVTTLPLTPERLMEVFRQKAGDTGA